MGKVEKTLIVAAICFLSMFFNVPETVKYIASGIILLCFLYLVKIVIWKK